MEITKIEAAAEFDLFGMIHGCQVVSGPRVANDDECHAYARWLAMKAGVVEAVTNSPDLKWRYGGRKNGDRVCIGAHFGDTFVAFPGADQSGAVTFELLDESGSVETAGTIYAKPNGALNISAADAAAIKESGKAWTKANKGKAKAAPVATVSEELDAPECATETPQDAPPATTLADDAEIAPQDEKNGLADDIEAQPDPVAALIARIEALEAAINGAKAGSATKSEKQTDLSTGTPIVAIETETPLPVQSKAKRSPSHIRAIMAYLAMRKERRIFKDAAQQFMDARDHIQSALQAESESHAATHMAMEKYQRRVEQERALVHELRVKRRLAVMRALTLRSNLRLSRDKAADRLKQIVDMSDRLISESSKATTAETCARAAENREATVKAELAELKRKIADPSNPARESDLLMLKGNAEAWQAKATAAIAEGERLKRLAVQNAGHIENLASRIARAETLLRESGQMPVLSIVPPSISVAA